MGFDTLAMLSACVAVRDITRCKTLLALVGFFATFPVDDVVNVAVVTDAVVSLSVR